MAEQYLYTIPYRELLLWDVKRYKKLGFTSQFSIEYLGNHIIPETEKIELSSYPEKNFDILGITNDKGMIDAYTAKGETFNQPYKIVKNGFIAYNPYRVNVGSIGIKTDETKGNLISPAYVVFSCKQTIIPEFLFFLMKTKQFHNQIKDNTSGSVRQNLTFDALSRIKIPVPPIEEQKQILFNYKYKVNKADEISKTSWDLIDKYFIETLQAKNYELKQREDCFFSTVKLSDLTRWDSWINSIGLKSLSYKVVPFETIINSKPQYGSGAKGVDVKCQYRYIRITDINEDGTLNNDIKYPQPIESKYVLNDGDFLIARSGNTVGKTFLYSSSFGPAIYAGYLVRYLLRTDLILPEYLLFYTKTKIFKNWVLKNQRIAGQPNINGQEYLAFPVILPSIEKQREIVNSAKCIYEQIQEEKLSAKNLIKQAKQDFEKAIFN